MTLEIYDLVGRVLARVLDGQRLAAGEHAFSWKPVHADGRAVAPGVYFVRLKTSDRVLNAKIALRR